MLQEADAIPYEPSRLRGERLLVLAPHPDDEAIGCGGLVAQHLAERRAVRVVVATNGAQAGDAATRETESKNGLAVLGVGATIEFLGFPDRGLADESDKLIERLGTELRAFRPDLILVPSPTEIHPDHFALSRAFCDLVQRDESLFAELATARVAFYEVSHPIAPNTLVDITDVAERKYRAVAAHASQLQVRDYLGYARGLNAYRAMTLPREMTAAEAYWLIDLPALRTWPFMDLRAKISALPRLEVSAEPVPVSVIVRTKDRPALLREAVRSIRAYPAAEIVVVNDGGARIDVEGTKLIEHDESRGRSIAANEGVRAASNPFIVFLDDDDLHYAEHLPALTTAAAQFPQRAAWYSDAVSAFVRIGESGELETTSRQRLFSQDFDRELLLVDNYIPLPTLLTRRDAFLEAGGFDPEFDLFEDWDFLIRLAQRGDFVHVPRVTCEIRHITGGGSITMSAPEGSRMFRDAKLQVWKKHTGLMTHDVFADAFERQKRRAGTLFSDAVEERGRAHHLEVDLARLEREKQELIAQMQAMHGELNANVLRLEGSVHQLNDLLASRNRDVEAAAGAVGAMKTHVENVERDLETKRAAVQNATSATHSAYAEIARLQGLLDMIYNSRTWKLHATLEKMRGRG
jgi:LmbE family N-acetylglucosaminyl deacetylase